MDNTGQGAELVRTALWIVSGAMLAVTAWGADATDGAKLLSQRVKPVLVSRCYGCHTQAAMSGASRGFARGAVEGRRHRTGGGAGRSR